MAVETFFLFGFRAFSDIIKDVFPPGEDNVIIKVINKFEAKEIDGAEFLNIIQSTLRKYTSIAFRDKDIKFHLIKQLEPSFGHKLIVRLDPIQPIVIAINNDDDIFRVNWASPEEIEESSGISFPLELFKRFLIEDLDVLKMISDDLIEVEKFDELNEIIVRALLGFTSAFFLRDDFKKNVKKELCNPK